ncbi:MAG: hypothetical protein AB8H80_04865 [Planctomycetota bacterium]
MNRLRLVAAAYALALLAAPSLAQRTYSGWFDSSLASGQLVYIGRTQSQWLADQAQAASFGLTPSHVEAYRDNNGPMLFDTSWHAGPAAAVVRFDQSQSAMLQDFNTYVGAGAKVLAFASYLGPQNDRRFFVAYSATGLTTGGYVELGIAGADLGDRYDWGITVGLRLQFLEAYDDANGDLRYDAVFEPNPGGTGLAVDQTFAGLQTSINTAASNGLNMRSYESYWINQGSSSGPSLRYTAIFAPAASTTSFNLAAPEPLSAFGANVNSQFQAGFGLRCFETRVRENPGASLYGQALTGSNGNSPGQAGNGYALIGQDIGYFLRSHDASLSSPSVGFLAVGFAPTNVPVLGGQLLVDPVTSFATTLAPNAQWTPLTVISALADPTLAGITLYSQLFELAPGQQQGVLMSPGLMLTIGRYQ